MSILNLIIRKIDENHEAILSKVNLILPIVKKIPSFGHQINKNISLASFFLLVIRTLLTRAKQLPKTLSQQTANQRYQTDESIKKQKKYYDLSISRNYTENKMKDKKRIFPLKTKRKNKCRQYAFMETHKNLNLRRKHLISNTTELHFTTK